MIKFLPSTGIINDTKIDFDLLGTICSNIFEKGFERRINIEVVIWKSKVKEQSTMERTSRSMRYYKMNLDTSGNRRYIFGTILHELRHAFQEYVFNFTHIARFATYNAYYNSQEERDARKQEKLTTELIKIYDSFKKAEEKFERFNLKELG
tara:strand:- start:10 stop:462 length:453 start_codon:yes stop_codon:yes gene_type:complete